MKQCSNVANITTPKVLAGTVGYAYLREMQVLSVDSWYGKVLELECLYVLVNICKKSLGREDLLRKETSRLLFSTTNQGQESWVNLPGIGTTHGEDKLHQIYRNLLRVRTRIPDTSWRIA